MLSLRQSSLYVSHSFNLIFILGIQMYVQFQIVKGISAVGIWTRGIIRQIFARLSGFFGVFCVKSPRKRRNILHCSQMRTQHARWRDVEHHCVTAIPSSHWKGKPSVFVCVCVYRLCCCAVKSCIRIA